MEHEATLNDLGKSIDLAISELQIKSAEELSVRVEQIDKIKDSLEKYQTQVTKKADEQIQQLTKECKSLSLEMKSELSTQESAYAEKLGQMQQVIKEYQIVVEEKYDGFIKRLESTDVDRIFTEIQNINQSIQTKFMILMGGIGIAIIISLIGLISK